MKKKALVLAILMVVGCILGSCAAAEEAVPKEELMLYRGDSVYYNIFEEEESFGVDSEEELAKELHSKRGIGVGSTLEEVVTAYEDLPIVINLLGEFAEKGKPYDETYSPTADLENLKSKGVYYVALPLYYIKDRQVTYREMEEYVRDVKKKEYGADAKEWMGLETNGWLVQYRDIPEISTLWLRMGIEDDVVEYIAVGQRRNKFMAYDANLEELGFTNCEPASRT